MIGQLRGKLIERQPPKLLIDVAGVGYELEASMNTCFKLPELGSEVLIYTQMIVREDDQRLYGFIDKSERSLFRSLIKVNGVGPKLAITILSGISAEDFVRCIGDNDTNSLVRLPGIGKKTAERLIVEMRDRLVDWQPELPSFEVNINTSARPTMGGSNPLLKEAVSALIALGYKPQEASRAISQVFQEGLSCEDLIRSALKGGVAA